MKQLIILSILLSVTFRLNAQNTELDNAKEPTPRIQIGPKIGYMTSTVYGSQIDIYSSGGYEFNRRNSISIGAHAKTSILPWWYVKFELNILQKGAEMGESYFIYPPKPYFTYLNIPVITGLRLEAIPDALNIGFEIGAALPISSLGIRKI